MEPTKDHQQIRHWAESRRALPARVRGTDDGTPAMLRFIIPGAHFQNRDLEEITWDHFFAKFDLLELAFAFQETTSSGEQSNLNQILRVESPIQDYRDWH